MGGTGREKPSKARAFGGYKHPNKRVADKERELEQRERQLLEKERQFEERYGVGSLSPWMKQTLACFADAHPRA